MNLERAILLRLASSKRAIPATAIREGLGQFLEGPHTLADLNAALTRLEAKGHVKGTANEDFGTLWKETDDGRLRIA